MAGRLHGKRVLVTGGGTGIGRAVAVELAKERAIIGIHYFRSSQHACELKAQLVEHGCRAETFQANLTQSDQAEQLITGFAAWAGGMDCLINNAGDIIARHTLDEMEPVFFRDVMAVNVDSAMMVTKAALPHLRIAARATGAGIVNMSSLAGRTGAGAGAAAYCASKAAIITWTRALARELGPDGIRVNAVAPGLILGTHFHDTHTPKETQDKVIATIPLRQAGQPSDVARAVVFLAGEYDGFINGATLDINGGVW